MGFIFHCREIRQKLQHVTMKSQNIMTYRKSLTEN